MSTLVFSSLPQSAQGAIEIVQLMFKLQPVEKRISLFCTDIQKMTPLHCASMFDHPELVEFLVNEGADVNALGKVLSHQC
jgi:transient receptor potential cation channel subfamily A member 1